MKKVTLLCASVALLGASQVHSHGGIVTDSNGNHVMAASGCVLHGDGTQADCGPKKMAPPKPEPKMEPKMEPKPEPKPKRMLVIPEAEPVVKSDLYLPPKPKAPEIPQIIKLDGVTFQSGSDRLEASSSIKLAEAAAILLKNPNVKVMVAGHTDSIGNKQSNIDLSKKRAEQVRQYLINKGVNGDNLESVGFGSSLSIADNGTAAGRAQNRRVELRITNQ